MSLARRAALQVLWQAKDASGNALLSFEGEPREITRDLGTDLLGLTYVDHLSGTADTLSLEIQDRDHKWSGDWQPVFGDGVEATITIDKADAWLTGIPSLSCGRFAHDKISIAGTPSRVSIGAVSAPLATQLRRRKRTQTWQGITLFKIASDIADRSTLNLDWIGADGMTYKRREQKDKSDLDFLVEACTEVGRTLKLTKEPERARWMLVIAPEEENDARAPIGTVDLTGGNVLSWAFDNDDSARYGTCHVKFFDPRKSGASQVTEFTYTDPANPDGLTLEKRRPVDDKAHAEVLARGLLRAANAEANTGHLTTMGDPGIVAGVTFDLANAYGFGGRYIVTKAEHKAVGGYTCSLDVRRTVAGY